ncbi:MAG: hypothetical protein K0R25_51 [Rickettsiaceae bacterium]|jgi:hypothetical protein|nr:hypothetical protein [Rickettsiaceae bacterium]
MFLASFYRARIISFALFCFLVSSCGFRPIYKTDNKISEEGREYKQELASIKIETVRKKLNQDLKNNLERILNPDNLQNEPRYSINISLSKSVISTFITSTGSSGRNKVTLTADYQLKDLNTGEIIATGQTSAKDDFNVENKRFGNYIAEEVIASNLTLLLAQNIRNLLIKDIVNDYKVKEKEASENQL